MSDEVPRIPNQPPIPPDAEAKQAAADFLSEMEKRRQTVTPLVVNEYAPTTAQMTAAAEPQKPKFRTTRVSQTSETGIIGFLIRRKIVANRSQANMVLVVITLINVAITVWVLWPSSVPTTSTPATPIPTNIKQTSAGIQ
jgi:hypothetical protein